MNNVLTALIFGAIGILTGSLMFFFVHQYFEKQRELFSTKREQLKYIFAPLEVMLKMNSQQYDHYLHDDTSIEEREFIEKNIWYPNYIEIKTILMEKSYLLDEIPDELMTLLNFISVWLSEYELVYVKNTKEPPVFIRPKGNIYPAEVDNFIFQKAGELRKLLSR
jgi:hypothetical protein